MFFVASTHATGLAPAGSATCVFGEVLAWRCAGRYGSRPVTRSRHATCSRGRLKEPVLVRLE